MNLHFGDNRKVALGEIRFQKLVIAFPLPKHATLLLRFKNYSAW